MGSAGNKKFAENLLMVIFEPDMQIIMKHTKQIKKQSLLGERV
jgi:hypothetical protein